MRNGGYLFVWKHRAIKLVSGYCFCSRIDDHSDWEFVLGDPTGPFALIVTVQERGIGIRRIAKLDDNRLILESVEGEDFIMEGDPAMGGCIYPCPLVNSIVVVEET